MPSWTRPRAAHIRVNSSETQGAEERRGELRRGMHDRKREAAPPEAHGGTVDLWAGAEVLLLLLPAQRNEIRIGRFDSQLCLIESTRNRLRPVRAEEQFR